MIGQYERQVAALLAADDAVAFARARQAIRCTIRPLGLKPGDGVILSPVTCEIVPLALLAGELVPVYADVNLGSMNLDPGAVSSASPEARAVLFQRTYGAAAGLEEITEVARTHDLLLMEDCAQCVPSYNNQPPLAGVAAFYSLNLRKPLPARGGGIMVTDNESLAGAVKELRDASPMRRSTRSDVPLRVASAIHRALLGPRTHWPLLTAQRLVLSVGPEWSLERKAEGVQREPIAPSRLQLEKGMSYLQAVNRWGEFRRETVQRYHKEFRGTNVNVVYPDRTEPLYFCPIMTPHKTRLLKRARRRMFEIVAWPESTPIYPHRDWERVEALGYKRGSCPTAEKVAAHLVGLPTDPSTHTAIVKSIASLVRSNST